ncbi:hypothetical protein AB0368_05860 [Actinoplanes sp. NPDC051475]|uniref:hypothetical protein n=1 Tax=Actinoplanes sp. NPDC051475 TaxID=3157225 RepID=UPI00344E15EB
MLKDRRDGFLLTDDPALLDHGLVHRWISTDTYWAAGRNRDTMDRAIAGSEVAGIYREPITGRSPSPGSSRHRWCRLRVPL